MSFELVVLLFPGQGSYVASILNELRKDWAQVDEVFDAIDSVCKAEGVGTVGPIIRSAQPPTLEDLIHTNPDGLQLTPDILPTLIQQICLEGSGFHHNLSIFRLLNGGQSLIRTYREVRRSAPAELQTALVSLVPEEWSRSFGSLTVRHRQLTEVDGDELGKQLLDKSTINLYSVALSHNNDGDGIGLHTFLSWQQATLSSPQT
jgi:hypothetical protein